MDNLRVKNFRRTQLWGLHTILLRFIIRNSTRISTRIPQYISEKNLVILAGRGGKIPL